MKKVNYLLVAVALIFATACGADKKEPKEEKEKTSTEEFSDMANDEEFVDQHDEPLELDVEAKGKMMNIGVPGGEDANIYRIDKEGSNNYLLVIHEFWGLNNHIISEADKLYDKLGNVNVIALDLYDGKLATKREKAKEYMQNADEDRIMSIIDAVYKIIPADASVGTIGWCFGGGWSLKTALQGGDRVDACVVYYGMPVKDVEKLKKLNSDVLFIYGTKDNWINTEVAENFKENMKEANKEVTVMAFDADHAFANPSSEAYKENAAQEANKAAFDYLKKRLD